MAKGDVVFFDQSHVDTDEALHDKENDVFKLGVIAGAIPAANDPDPRWGAGGATNYATSEVTPGGNYTAGGPTLANNSVTLVSGASVFDADDIAIAQNGANPTNGTYGIIYNDTDVGKRALGYVDLGGATDMTAGPFNLNWNASGICSTAKAA